MQQLVIGFFIVAVSMLLPEVYTSYFVAGESTPYTWYLHGESLAYLLLLITILLITKSLGLKLVLMVFLILLQASELLHFTYLGTFYSQYNISYMLSELGDFLNGIVSLFGVIWPTAVVCLLSALVAVIALCWEHKSAQHFRSNIPIALTAIMLTFPFIKGLSSENHFKPSAKQLSIRNGLYSLNFFAVMAFSMKEKKDYTPYQLVGVEPEVDNLVLIVGESANASRMSLFGSERDTTPYLSSLAHSKDFHYQLALSSAVATQYALGYFFNGVYEPDNVKQMGSKATNLFKIASENGFELHMISNHTEGTMSHSYRYGKFTTWVDKTMPGNTWGQYDVGMVEAYLNARGSKRNKQFVVLHMQNMHVGYKDQYPPEFEQFTAESPNPSAQLRAEYDNAVTYMDYTIETWINQLKDAFDGRTLVLYIPDHGENLGDNGKTGHGHLDVPTATVPIMAFNLKHGKQALDLFKKDLGCLTSHYKIHKAIARLLGARVENPNANDQEFYINGLSLYGDAGWIKGEFKEHEALCQLAARPRVKQHQPLVYINQPD